MFDPLDLSSYAMAGVAGAVPGYGISGVEELASGPAIKSPTTGHQQQGHPSPMNSHAAAGSSSPPSLTHRDSLSLNSSENTEVSAKESTPSALSDPATTGGASTAGDDAPAPPVVKAGRKLPKPVMDFLRKWLLEHADHPYPNEQEKKMLCEKTGLTMHQLSNWMINARRRILVPASKVIQTIGSSPYNMGQRQSTSTLAAAHAYRVVDPSSTTGPSGSATGPAPSHYIPHLLPEQLAAGVQRSQRGLAPSSAGVVVGSQTASPGLQGQAAQLSGAAFPSRGLQRPSPTWSHFGSPRTPSAFSPLNSVCHPENSVLLFVEESASYLDRALRAMGLHTEAVTSFITYWLPCFMKHTYIALQFIPQIGFEEAAPLQVEPKPDIVTRIFMLYQPVMVSQLDKWSQASDRAVKDPAFGREVVGIDIEKQKDPSLFRVVEWGGMEAVAF
ncbi:hypothetical protein FRC04_002875 [Tulasnella sp. 424]|nr:hypothetical protein FRC04_002875 [Tulasnella sp. 424]